MSRGKLSRGIKKKVSVDDFIEIDEVYYSEENDTCVEEDDINENEKDDSEEDIPIIDIRNTAHQGLPKNLSIPDNLSLISGIMNSNIFNLKTKRY